MKYNLTPKLPKMLHGADYNPEQWLDSPEILERDIELMKKAKINCVSVGIFSWAALEPEEGRYELDWLADIIDRLYENGIYTVLATPTGAKPSWMAIKYPEICRVRQSGVRERPSGRHNHCFSSPVFREKTRLINTELAKRFAHHPAVILWHVSNEIQGECFCENCTANFRKWLRERYGTLDALNKAWWTMFWSHTYFDWNDIDAPVDGSETCVQGLMLDWKRFCTDMQVDFFKWEIAPLKAENPDIPVTINMMGYYDRIDYQQFVPYLDVISWDSYPQWHSGEDDGDETDTAMWNASWHDYMRAMKQQPFLLMECTPSTANWCEVSRQKKPGLHKAVSLQAIAHGSNSVQYFQWRASRGSAEKFHSAVVGHDGTENSRIFRHCAEVGDMLEKLGGVCDTNNSAEAAILIDMQNSWAINETKGPRNKYMGYYDTYYNAYKVMWEQGIPCDVIGIEASLDKYKLLVVPMLYMLRGGIEKKLAEFVRRGGVLISTYFTGLVDETDLCFLGETPALGLSEVFGIVTEELDALYDHQSNSIVMKNNYLGLSGEYAAKKFCEVIRTNGAEVLGVYGRDYYKDKPAMTLNRFGKGRAYYLATQPGIEFFKPFILSLCSELDINPVLETELPRGISVTHRSGEGGDYIFIINFRNEEQSLFLPYPLKDILTDRVLDGKITLMPYEAIAATKNIV